jgi:NAD(P)-dependent dehydrogenase (short-subunit alcohol dehydrogenase family)
VKPRERKVALINGAGSSLGREVALELSRAGMALALFNGPQPCHGRSEIEAAVRGASAEVVVLGTSGGEIPVKATYEIFGRLDCLVNLLVPTPETDSAQLYRAPMLFLSGALAASDMLLAKAPGSAIVNHCFLPSAFAGTRFEDCMPAVRGAMTGITHTLCRRFAAKGITVNCIQTGLLSMPETHAQGSSKVLAQKVPIGRWGTLAQVARLTSFLATRNRYWTGRSIIVDGGLTSRTQRELKVMDGGADDFLKVGRGTLHRGFLRRILNEPAPYRMQTDRPRPPRPAARQRTVVGGR